MKKSIRNIILILLALLLFAGISFGLKYAYIASSYASKMACSCHFISGRELSDIKKNDLYAVSFVDVNMDEKDHSVSSSIYGFAKTTAVFREGFGCSLLNNVSEDSLKKQIFPFSRNPLQHEFPVATLSNVFDSLKLDAVMQPIFNDDSGRTLQTRAVIILKDGNLVYEKYGTGYDRTSSLIGWSMTKSVTNAMVGILVKDGKLSLDKKNLLEEWQKDDRKNISLNDLLHMSSGLDFVEDYASPSDATNMLFRSYAAGAYAIKSKLKDKPGEVFYYSSGTSNILQEIIKREFASKKDYQRFPYERLFDKIGMSTAILETDPSGTFIGSSFMYATALDWARFGQLYLQDGIWNGERILPEGWAKYSGTETPNSNGRYAAHFWIDHNDKVFPADAFFADGFEGQFVNIIPSENMVIVRLGCTHGENFDNTSFIKNILKAKK
jgi:CubicO group peptidase (beta-lactamase class C family)